jgi:predicted porin
MRIAMLLRAAVIAGTLASAVAHAQSTSSITLYGAVLLDAEVLVRIKQDATSGTPGTPPSGATQNQYRVSSNSTRIGVRGTEPLGDGLSAFFQVESQPDASNSGGALASRDTFVGLQGSWGTLKAGYFFSPYYDYGSIFGNVPTYRSSILASHSLWGNNGYNGANVATGSFEQRIANSVRYDTPRVAGFSGNFQVGARDTGGDNGGDVPQQRRHAYVITGGGQYNNGPIVAGLVYEQHNKLREGTPTNPNMQDQGLTAAGSYNFGLIKVAAAFEWLKYDVPQGGDLKRNYWAITGTGNLGPGQYYIGYWKANNGSGSAKCTTTAGITSCPRIGALTLGPDTGAQQWELSYTYPLSKRTSLYAGYTFIDNQKNGAYNFGINMVPGVCTGNAQNAQGNNVGCGDAGKPQGLLIGIAHFF